MIFLPCSSQPASVVEAQSVSRSHSFRANPVREAYVKFHRMVQSAVIEARKTKKVPTDLDALYAARDRFRAATRAANGFDTESKNKDSAQEAPRNLSPHPQ